MSVLDDTNYIAQFDPQNYIGFAGAQPGQLGHDFGLSKQQLGHDIANVVFAGMGGSSLAAELAHTWPQLRVPFVVCKTYTLPAFVDAHTLVICASYSGNTEETIAALHEAEAKKAQIMTIAHGGKLAELARQAGYPLAELPHCPQPRAAVFYMYRALTEVLVGTGLVSADKIAELAALQAELEGYVREFAAQVPAENNLAKQLAEQMAGKTAIIYAGTLMFPAAYKWKIDVNETSKNTAWAGQYPEFNHNEFIGWSSHPIEKPFAVLDLVSRFEHPRILKRFAVTERLLSGLRPKAITIDAKGESVLEQLLYLVLLGDFTTTYLGILNGVNPTPVDLVEKFKVELNKGG